MRREGRRITGPGGRPEPPVRRGPAAVPGRGTSTRPGRRRRRQHRPGASAHRRGDVTIADPPARGRELATASKAAQRAAFVDLVLANPSVAAIVERMPATGLPQWYLTAGAL